MAANFNDKEALTSALSSIKHMTMIYNDTATQTDDPQLAKELCSLIDEEHQARIQVYQIMNQNGWYNPELIDEQQLQKAQQKQAQAAQQATTANQFGQWGGGQSSQAGSQWSGQTSAQWSGQNGGQWGATGLQSGINQ